MKTLVLLLPIAVLTASCTTPYTARQLSDYDGDGYVSDAEYKQFMKQRNVEDRAVYSESVKRRNVANTVQDANRTVWGARSLLEGIRSF